MSAQDHAANTRAAARPPTKEKPTSQGYALTLAIWVSVASSCACGIALFIGIFPHGTSASPIAYVLPFVAAPMLAFGMAAAWHLTLNVAAHAHELHRKIVVVVVGLFLFGVGCATSAWLFASYMGGYVAMQTYQQQALEHLKHALAAVAANAASDAPLLAAVEQSSAALRTAAASEDRAGVVARGKKGKGVAYNGLNDAADNMAKTANSMRDRKGLRDAQLAAAQNSISDAETNVESGSRNAFEQAYSKARVALVAVENIRLSADASALNIGWAVDRSAAPFVANTVQDIDRIRQRADATRQPVTLPTFKAISDQEAVKLNPPALAWIAGVMIEALPLAMLALLLLLWREPHNDPRNEPPQEAATRQLPVYSPRNPPNLQAAE